MNNDRTIALEQIIVELELLSVEEQIWVVERLTDRILIQMDQPKMSPVSNPTLYTEESNHRFSKP